MAEKTRQVLTQRKEVQHFDEQGDAKFGEAGPGGSRRRLATIEYGGQPTRKELRRLFPFLPHNKWSMGSP
jgi:hypothetical protein